jgi:S1-C subfamily serine protease
MRREGQATYEEARFLYEYDLTQLRLAVYVPGEIDRRRGGLLTHVTHLKRNGFATLAGDLEAELDKAGRTPTAERSQQARTKPSGSRGTGFIVRPDGHVLTSFHVVENAKTVTVRCPDQKPAIASITAAAASNDLALLRITQTGLPYLSLGRARLLQLGDSVFTIGFPTPQLLGTDPKFSDGSVSGLSGPGGEASLLQVTIPVQPGNSGGPMLNASGQVVGVVAASASIRPFLSATGTLPQNINWAVKADYAMPLFDQPPVVSANSRAEVIKLALSATCLIDVDR